MRLGRRFTGIVVEGRADMAAEDSQTEDLLRCAVRGTEKPSSCS